MTFNQANRRIVTNRTTNLRVLPAVTLHRQHWMHRRENMQRYNALIEAMGAQQNPWGDGPPPIGTIIDGPNGESRKWDGNAWAPFDG